MLTCKQYFIKSIIESIGHKGGEKILKLTITIKTYLPLLFLTLTVLFCVSTVSANEIYVNTTGNDTSGTGTSDNPYLTIQTGINNLDPDGTIRIAKGEYSGVNNTNITIDKNMTIIGESQADTIVNGAGITQIFNIITGVNVIIKNLTLVNGNTTHYLGGGAIFNNGNLTVNNCTFTNNTAYSGGAISNNGTLTVNACNFSDNDAGVGGAILNYGNCTVSDSNFTHNQAITSGGAILAGGNCTINGCIFINNTANNGGATLGSCILSNSTFYGNNATYTGGAIYISGDSTLTNCEFTNNSAKIHGNAIFNYYANLYINNCNFALNTGANYGGAILNNGNLTVLSSIFTGNIATWLGGAILNNFNLTVTNSNFENNTAFRGGAIQNGWIFVGTANAHFNRLYNNMATEGSAIYSQNGVINATNNWWGSNDGPAAGSIEGEFVEYDPWLVMRYSASPVIIPQGSISTLTADFRYDSDGTYHDPALGHLPDDLPVTFTTTLGNVGSKLAIAYTLNGISTILLRGDEAAGYALSSALFDLEQLFTTVQITAVPVNAASSTVSSTKTVKMQATGAPLAGIVLAILMVLGGFISTSKKK
jgi:predicted outer membrane repeat protein